MAGKRYLYKWFYDNIHCHYYDIVTGWCFLLSSAGRRNRTLRRFVLPAKELAATGPYPKAVQPVPLELGFAAEVEAFDLEGRHHS